MEDQLNKVTITEILLCATPEKEDQVRGLLSLIDIQRMSDIVGFEISTIFKIITYTERTIHQMWLLNISLWASLYAYSDVIKTFLAQERPLNFKVIKLIPEQEIYVTKYKEAFDTYKNINSCPTEEINISDTLSLPNFKYRPQTPIPAAMHDLHYLSLAFVLLHEVKHIIFKIQGENFKNPKEEEIECDKFAYTFLLDQIDAYCSISKEPYNSIIKKRSIAVALAYYYFFVTSFINHDIVNTFASHPTFSERIISFFKTVTFPGDHDFWLIISSFVITHLDYLKRLPLEISFSDYKDLSYTLINYLQSLEKG